MSRQLFWLAINADGSITEETQESLFARESSGDQSPEKLWSGDLVWSSGSRQEKYGDYLQWERNKMADINPAELLPLVSDIVAAQVANNKTTPAELPQ